MKDRLRNVAESTGLLDVRNLRRRVTSLEKALPEHAVLQRLLEHRVDELEATVRSIREQRS